MSDQEHLSAEYMQGKAVALLSRCGEMAAKLQVLMRLCGTLVMRDELTVRTRELIEVDSLPAPVSVVRNQVTVQLASKADPDVVRQSAELMAPASALNQLDHVMREAAHLHESIMEQHRARQQQQYETALRRAGLMVEAGGKLMAGMKPPVEEDDLPPPPSIVDALLALPPDADAEDALDDLTAMQMALGHLERSAPAVWNLGDRLKRAEHSHARGDLLLAELGDQYAAVKARLDRARDRHARIALELAEEDRSANGKKETPAQQVRRRLDELKRKLADRKKDSLAHRAKEAVRKMEADAAEASKLMEEFQRAEKAMKRKAAGHGGRHEATSMRNSRIGGIDLERIMRDSSIAAGPVSDNGKSFLLLDSTDSGTPSHASSSSSSSKRPPLLTPAFPVQFASDGSGRLLAVGQAGLSAHEVLGFHRTSEADRLALMHGDANGEEVLFGTSEERLEWCRHQLALMASRMPSRFASLTKHLDAWSVERVRRRREDEQVERRIEERIAALSAYVREDLAPELASFRADVHRQVESIARASRAWEEKGRYYERVHRESMVLLQRMGEEVESIVR